MKSVNVGDRVRLKGDGNAPAMTVTAYVALLNQFRCEWFTPEKERRIAFFAEAALEFCSPGRKIT